MGLLAGIHCARLILGLPLLVPPPETAHGALIYHLTASDPSHFQPSNVNFGLFPPLKKKIRKKERGRVRAKLALEALDRYQAMVLTR
jgi:methylenetetrahydrofolate--tRNA-(uracil-5-)-methyltransferase